MYVFGGHIDGFDVDCIFSSWKPGRNFFLTLPFDVDLLLGPTQVEGIHALERLSGLVGGTCHRRVSAAHSIYFAS